VSGHTILRVLPIHAILEIALEEPRDMRDLDIRTTSYWGRGSIKDLDLKVNGPMGT
jgi:hypothetical protein